MITCALTKVNQMPDCKVAKYGLQKHGERGYSSLHLLTKTQRKKILSDKLSGYVYTTTMC